MRIEIDQSGKIEDTSKPTVVAFSNSKSGILLISAREKKSIQKLFREAGNSRIFIFKTFAALVFILIKSYLSVMPQIIIDREYPGYEKLIKRFIIEIAAKNNIKADPKSIHFSQIGKKSKAHDIAIEAFRKNRAVIKVKYVDLLKILL